jgi:hypothetical protein
MLAWGIGAAPSFGQIFVANSGNGTIGEYTISGGMLNPSLISGLSSPEGIVVSGGELFVANSGNGTVGEYTLGTTPGTIASSTPSLISGLSSPDGIAVSGSDLFVTTGVFPGAINEYTTSGGMVSTSIISNLGVPTGLAVSGSDLFISLAYGGDVGEYTTSGGMVKPSLVTGLAAPQGVAVSGSDLFVTNHDNGTIGGYAISSGSSVNVIECGGSPEGIAASGSNLFVTNDGAIGEFTTSGGTVTSSLITGLSTPMGIAVSSLSLTNSATAPAGSNLIGDITMTGSGTLGYPAQSSAVSGAASTTGYLSVSGWNPANDTEIYGLDATGETSLSQLISDLQAAVNAGATVEAPTGSAGALLTAQGDNIEVVFPTGPSPAGSPAYLSYDFSNYNTNGTVTISNITVVPEPRGVGVLAVAGLSLCFRRRRKLATT